MKRVISIATCLLFLATASFAQLDPIPDLQESTAHLVNYGGIEICVLLVIPDGSGPDLAEARTLTGEPVDASILLVLRDGFGVPMPGILRDRVWIDPLEGPGTAATCPDAGTFRYDSNYPYSNDDGEVFWHSPIHGGGWSMAPAGVYVYSMPLTSNGGLRLWLVSPDINGDLEVNLTDAGLMAADLAAGYAFRSDLIADGVLNLSDVGVMANSLGASCQ